MITGTIDFFHLDALSPAVPLKVAVDLHLTLLGGTLYRLLGERLGVARAHDRPRTFFRKCVRAGAEVMEREKSLTVGCGRRAHNPVLEAAGIAEDSVPLPWLGNRPLRFAFV